MRAWPTPAGITTTSPAVTPTVSPPSPPRPPHPRSGRGDRQPGEGLAGEQDRGHGAVDRHVEDEEGDGPGERELDRLVLHHAKVAQDVAAGEDHHPGDRENAREAK